MTKFLRVAWHEYSRHVFRKRFLFVLFSVPLMIMLMVALVIGMIIMQTSSKPVGYVDYSGLLSAAVAQPKVKWPDKFIPIVAYPDEDSAKADLTVDNIQAYFVIPEDYLASGQTRVIFLDKLKGSASEQFTAFMKVNLLKGLPAEISNRILEGNELIVRSMDNSREASQNQIINIVIPMIAGILFIVCISTSSGYLMQAVVEEKENRTMEVMVTSVSPNQLMSGKVIADIAVGVTQLFIWTIFIILALVVGKNYVPWLGGLKLYPEMTLSILAVMVPAFIMISGLMAAVGATVSDASEGQQFMGLFTIPLWFPYLLIGVFIQNPNSPLAVALSLFPLTAPMTITIRLGFTTIPAWQMIASVVILILSAIGAIWLAGRAFRLGMLRYGQRIRWKEVLNQQRN